MAQRRSGHGEHALLEGLRVEIGTRSLQDPEDIHGHLVSEVKVLFGRLGAGLRELEHPVRLPRRAGREHGVVPGYGVAPLVLGDLAGLRVEVRGYEPLGVVLLAVRRLTERDLDQRIARAEHRGDTRRFHLGRQAGPFLGELGDVDRPRQEVR